MAHRAFARATRRKTQWGGFGNASGAAVLPSEITMAAGTPVILSTSIIIGNAAGLLDEEVTITRTIGSHSISIDATTAELDVTVAVGCAVARNEAISAGVGSLPSPEDDPDFEWLYYGVFGLRNPQNALQDGPLSSIRTAFDVRGQRIVRSGQTLVWLAESEGGAAVAMVGGRYLVKLT